MRPAVHTPKVRLIHKDTGDILEAWPVDAREHLRAGDYVRESDYLPASDAPAGESDAETNSDDDAGTLADLPGIRALAAVIRDLPDAVVEAMQAKDTRKTAAAIYAARLTPSAQTE